MLDLVPVPVPIISSAITTTYHLVPDVLSAEVLLLSSAPHHRRTLVVPLSCRISTVQSTNVGSCQLQDMSQNDGRWQFGTEIRARMAH